MAENYSNKYETTLNGAISSSATSIVVSSATGIPTVSFRAILTDGTNFEFIRVTAAASTTLTVTREAEDAVRFPKRAWSSGAALKHIVTAATLDNLVQVDGDTMTGALTINPGAVTGLTITSGDATAAIVSRNTGASSVTVPFGAVQIGLAGTNHGTGGGPSFLFFASDSAGNKEFVGRLNAVWQSNTDGAEKGAVTLSVRATAGDNGTTEVLRVNADLNVGINTTAQFGSGTGVIGIANRTAAPSGTPSGGGVLYAESGALKWKGSSATVTTIANAEPHCPVCGRDAVLEWENGEQGWHIELCTWCLAEELGARPWIKRVQH